MPGDTFALKIQRKKPELQPKSFEINKSLRRSGRFCQVTSHATRSADAKSTICCKAMQYEKPAFSVFEQSKLRHPGKTALFPMIVLWAITSLKNMDHGFQSRRQQQQNAQFR